MYLQGPIQFDYGCFTEIGDNSYANFNLTCLDCAPVKIGKMFYGTECVTSDTGSSPYVSG